MKTRTKIVGILVALLPAVLCAAAVQLEGPPEMVKLGEGAIEEPSITFLTHDTIRPKPIRTLSEQVRYEFGLEAPKVRKHRRHHRKHHWKHHRHLRPRPASYKAPALPEAPPKAPVLCVRRNGITICDPKAHTRTKIGRRPRRGRSWYLPERRTNRIEPFGDE
jgi:hypothetical protein